MGILIKADFKSKLPPKLQKFDAGNPDPDYQAGIFCVLFSEFPQFKAHVAAYVERHYCTVINDEDHPSPQKVLLFLKPEEIKWLNEWILTRGKKPRPMAP